MDNALIQYNEGFAFTQEQIKVIKSQIAKGANDDELAMFTTIAEKYGLDPFLKEIWFIKSVKKQKDNRGNWDYPRLKDGTVDYSKAETLIYTSRDGYLKVAQRDVSFMGILSMAVCEGDKFEIDAENYKVTHQFGSKRGKIIGAWAKVDHAKKKPVISYVPIEEYRTDKSTTWKQYPTAMIIKVAEVFALKRQFGISGLVTTEEMSHMIPDEPELKAIEVEVIEGKLEADIKAKTEIVDPGTGEILPATIDDKQIQDLFISANRDTKLLYNIMALKRFNYTHSKDIKVTDLEAIKQIIADYLKDGSFPEDEIEYPRITE